MPLGPHPAARICAGAHGGPDHAFRALADLRYDAPDPRLHKTDSRIRGRRVHLQSSVVIPDVTGTAAATPGILPTWRP
jgi:hypothetical protein